MYEFSYHRPADLASAVAGLRADPEAKILAGGMTLIPSMKMRLAAPSQLLDVAGLADLQGIVIDARRVRIGAGMRHGTVADSDDVRQAIPALATLAGLIGDPQVRARGTLGGALANNDPAADYPAAVLALAAIVQTDRRDIAADDFFQGMFTTALEADEVIRAVSFERPASAAYAKFHHPASGYAMTAVFVARLDAGVRVAVTGAGPGVFRWTDAEQALTSNFAKASVDRLTMPADGLNDDMHAPAAYRAHLASVMLQRAVADCLS